MPTALFVARAQAIFLTFPISPSNLLDAVAMLPFSRILRFKFLLYDNVGHSTVTSVKYVGALLSRSLLIGRSPLLFTVGALST
jgi:hypothetical protein